MKKAVLLLLSQVFAIGFGFAQTQLIGVASIGATLDNNSSGQAEAFIATASATGSVASMSVYLDKSSAVKAVYVGLYSNLSGHPGSLLGAGQITSPIAGHGTRWLSLQRSRSQRILPIMLRYSEREG